MQIDYILSGIYLFGVFQGLMLCLGLLTVGANKNRANRILALLIGLITVFVARKIGYTSKWITDYPHILAVFYPIVFALGPLLYFYTQALVGEVSSTLAHRAAHFIPLIFTILITRPSIKNGNVAMIGEKEIPIGRSFKEGLLTEIENKYLI